MAKKIFITLIISLLSATVAFAQCVKNNAADNIAGLYEGVQNGIKFRAKIEKETTSTFRARMVWLENDRDANGNKLLDAKNPDKALRSTPADRIVVISGLRYMPQKKQWGETKIYDPLRGIKAKVVCWFDNDNTLKIKGSLMGFSETVVWKKIG